MESETNFYTDPSLLDDDLISRIALEKFGIKYIFPWQRLVISNIIEALTYQTMLKDFSELERIKFESDNSDSFCLGRQIVLLPTGAGKSLCFQIPSLVFDGPTLVIYPLLALMTDQMRRMDDGNIESVTFRGGQSESLRSENFAKIKNGAKIIIANPEILQDERILERLAKVGIKHIAIDEAHCVSEWGDSFRPSYLKLGEVIKKINPPVITAFTATASPQVLSRISEILFNGEAHVVRSESDRQNIHYFVKKCCAKKKEALVLAKTQQKPMIIFCGTRDNAQNMAMELNNCYGKGTSKFYHAGLERKEKESVEKWFYNSKNGILCATCAYGMGVDKKDIKTVIHLEPPKTAEAYIQEAGRGGRDGSISKAILLWSLEDSLNFSVYKETSREVVIKKFAETTECRRQVLLDALGAEQAVCSGCDLCNEREYKHKLQAMPKFKMYINSVKEKRNRYVSDWQLTYNMIKKRKNFYSEEEAAEKISQIMKRKSIQKLGINVWNHSDSIEVLSQLKESDKIKTDNYFWKNKLSVKKINP